MDSIKQRIAIAEFCGWSQIHPSGRLDGQMVGYPPVNAIVGKPEEIPNYVLDLNAMNIAEGYFAGSNHFLWADYVNNLRHVWTGSPIHAPAQWRAEALLRTIGKWIQEDRSKTNPNWVDAPQDTVRFEVGKGWIHERGMPS